MDAKWAIGLKRLGEAGARAHRDRLRSMTPDESLREFERHCAEIHRTFPPAALPRTHPVGLVRFWTRS